MEKERNRQARANFSTFLHRDHFDQVLSQVMTDVGLLRPRDVFGFSSFAMRVLGEPYHRMMALRMVASQGDDEAAVASMDSEIRARFEKSAACCLVVECFGNKDLAALYGSYHAMGLVMKVRQMIVSLIERCDPRSMITLAHHEGSRHTVLGASPEHLIRFAVQLWDCTAAWNSLPHVVANMELRIDLDVGMDLGRCLVVPEEGVYSDAAMTAGRLADGLNSSSAEFIISKRFHSALRGTPVLVGRTHRKKHVPAGPLPRPEDVAAERARLAAEEDVHRFWERVSFREEASGALELVKVDIGPLQPSPAQNEALVAVVGTMHSPALSAFGNMCLAQCAPGLDLQALRVRMHTHYAVDGVLMTTSVLRPGGKDVRDGRGLPAFLSQVSLVRRRMFALAADQAGGRLLSATGNCILSMFDSIEAAMRCACEATVHFEDEDTPIALTFAIAAGPVLVIGEEGAVYGPCVDFGLEVSASVVARSTPGCIALNRQAYELSEGLSMISLSPLGDDTVPEAFRVVEIRGDIYRRKSVRFSVPAALRSEPRSRPTSRPGSAAASSSATAAALAARSGKRAISLADDDDDNSYEYYSYEYSYSYYTDDDEEEEGGQGGGRGRGRGSEDESEDERVARGNDRIVSGSRSGARTPGVRREDAVAEDAAQAEARRAAAEAAAHSRKVAVMKANLERLEREDKERKQRERRKERAEKEKGATATVAVVENSNQKRNERAEGAGDGARTDKGFAVHSALHDAKVALMRESLVRLEVTAEFDAMEARLRQEYHDREGRLRKEAARVEDARRAAVAAAEEELRAAAVRGPEEDARRSAAADHELMMQSKAVEDEAKRRELSKKAETKRRELVKLEREEVVEEAIERHRRERDSAKVVDRSKSGDKAAARLAARQAALNASKAALNPEPSALLPPASAAPSSAASSSVSIHLDQERDDAKSGPASRAAPSSAVSSQFQDLEQERRSREGEERVKRSREGESVTAAPSSAVSSQFQDHEREKRSREREEGIKRSREARDEELRKAREAKEEEARLEREGKEEEQRKAREAREEESRKAREAREEALKKSREAKEEELRKAREVKEDLKRQREAKEEELRKQREAKEEEARRKKEEQEREAERRRLEKAEGVEARRRELESRKLREAEAKRLRAEKDEKKHDDEGAEAGTPLKGATQTSSGNLLGVPKASRRGSSSTVKSYDEVLVVSDSESDIPSHLDHSFTDAKALDRNIEKITFREEKRRKDEEIAAEKRAKVEKIKQGGTTTKLTPGQWAK
jgi:hypothetical protein